MLNAFSEKIFFKELTFSDLKFKLDNGNEVELADLAINLGNSLIAIQLKERDLVSQSNDIETESMQKLKL